MPQAFDPQTSMPAQVFSLSQDGASLDEAIPNAGEKIITMVAYMKGLGNSEEQRLEEQFQKARKNHPHITAKLGEKIFSSLNCAGCHSLGSMKPWKNGPDLSNETSRVKDHWLKSYLEKPKPIRPFGFFPGTGSRMPDFRLSFAEVATITEHFPRPSMSPYKSVQLSPLSLFSSRKAEIFLRDKLPCLGCHQLNGEGGRIAPDLSTISQRLRPEFIAAMIRDPQDSAPGTMMPKTPMYEDMPQVIVSYLVLSENAPDTSRYLSLTDFPLASISEGLEGPQLYAQWCSPCHGANGNGNGFNSSFLPVQPASHSSKSLMSPRADDTIFDGIHNGGGILGKSHRMPMFGQTLTRDQILSIIRYIRELCRCEAPAWSDKSK